MHKIWLFQLEDQVYTVTLDHGLIDSSRLITLNGVEVERVPARLIIDWGSRHDFTIPAPANAPDQVHTCTVIIRTTLFSLSYDLEIDGVSIRTGRFKVSNTPNMLLLPSAPPKEGQKVLLRPVEASTDSETTGAEQLVRASEEPCDPGK